MLLLPPCFYTLPNVKLNADLRVHTEGLAAVQVHPRYIIQFEEHPSPFKVLPSSH